MNHKRSWKRAAWVTPLFLVPAIVAACTRPSDPAEDVGEVKQADFTNGGFEDGGALVPPPAPWTVTTFLNNGITPTSPQTRAALNLQAGGTARTFTLESLQGPGVQVDPDLGSFALFRWPKYGNKVALVNKQGASKNVNSLTQQMTIQPGDVDPVDNRAHVRFVWAPVLEDPLGQPLRS